MLRLVEETTQADTVTGRAVCGEIRALLEERLPLLPVTDEQRGTLFALYVGLGGREAS